MKYCKRNESKGERGENQRADRRGGELKKWSVLEGSAFRNVGGWKTEREPCGHWSSLVLSVYRGRKRVAWA